ncbi:MAG: hypothetical protein IPK74_02785 [Deltaproteobacteria bacterium]|nr:hypothetical protein [Deltaproteobacteria bacterium]
MQRDPEEPFRIAWDGGCCCAGYLGRNSWRCRLSTGVVSEASTAIDATTLLLNDVFAGILAGEEVRRRAPISVRVGSVCEFELFRDARMTNGWRFSSVHSRGDIGDHSRLAAWLEAIARRNVDRLWAREEKRPECAPLGDEFSFGAFQADTDPAERCKRLESILSARLLDHPSPEAVLEVAVADLRALGHDLWSWDPDRVWGPDYVTRRVGAGMMLSLRGAGDDDDATLRIAVEFSLPR